jgi:hypothetical protein
MEEEREKLDIDFLFENFDNMCKVEFKPLAIKAKEESVIRSLASTFDRLCLGNNEKPHFKGKSKEKVRKVSVERGSKDKINTIKKKLRLNLEEVFGWRARRCSSR